MNSAGYVNLYELKIQPALDTLYRGPRFQENEVRALDTINSGRYAYSCLQTAVCTEPTAVSRIILKDMIHKRLASAITGYDRFFDVSPYSLSGTIAGNLLYKEDVFSVARSFELQVVFDPQDFYLAVLAGQKVYNRLRLPEVLELLGKNAFTLPQRALCFTGEKGQERWRDGKILAFVSPDVCIVQVPSVQPSEISVPTHRVIPKLGITMIKRLLYLKGSSINIEQKLTQFRSDRSKSVETHYRDSSDVVRRENIGPLFPIQLGSSQIHIGEQPVQLKNLSSKVITKRFPCASKVENATHEFDSIRDGLKRIEFRQVVTHPVAIFCTRDTKTQTENLVATLNRPPDAFGDFKGMPVHFGVRLEPLSDCPYVVNNVEEYIDQAQSFVLSPNQHKQAALALFYLSDEDETYKNPVPLYYRLKALLARAGHPSQMVDRITLTNKYARWNLALNLAAKLGTIPWTLKDDSSLQPVELFLGFSYSSIRPEKLGQSRNIAYVNVFDSAGTWRLFYADGKVFSFEERLKVFPRLASEVVRSVTDKPTALRLIEVHYNKRFGLRERQAIAIGIRSLAPNASIIFVSITDEHPVRFYDAARGTALLLGENTAYVQTIETDKSSGIPRPLRIHVYRDFCSLPVDCYSVCERILGLTRLNWRSIKDYSSLPVTILYSSRVARLTTYFSLSEWKEIDHSLKRTPWFL